MDQEKSDCQEEDGRTFIIQVEHQVRGPTHVHVHEIPPNSNNEYQIQEGNNESS